MFKKEIVLIICIIFLFSDFSIKEYKIINKRKNIISTSFVLNIPKINISEKLYYSKLSDKVYNIVIYEEFGRPNYNSNTVIGAHSGNGKYSYFKNLYKLNINDYIFIKYKNISDEYKIFSKFYVDEYEIDILYKSYDFKVITFITCKNNDDSKRLILLAKLVS